MFGKLTLLTVVNLALGIGVANAEGGDMTSTKGADSMAGGSMAAEISTETKARFRQLDKNGDGGVSQSEAKSNKRLQVGFKDSDANKNGKIEEAEFAQFELVTGEFTDERGKGGVSNPMQTDSIEGGSNENAQ